MCSDVGELFKCALSSTYVFFVLFSLLMFFFYELTFYARKSYSFFFLM